MRRELAAATAAMALGAALLLFLTSRGWVTLHVARDRPLSTLRRTVDGSAAQPWLTAMGVLGLAGAVALLATRRVGRVLVGGLVALAGAVVLWRVIGDATGVPAGRARSLLDGSGPVVGVAPHARVAADPHPGPVALAATAGALLLLAGLLAALRGRAWPAMGSRYERPVEPETAPVAGAEPPAHPSDRRLWEALDRGEDPTSR